ncbi:MAG: hypothetical protein AAF919_19150 [Pseudomonadota bacterium]
MVRTLLAAALATTLMTPAQADEAMSAQLVDCSFIVPLSDMFFADDPSTLQDATIVSADYQATAMRHAAFEGHGQPAAYVAEMAAAKKDNWMSRDPSWLEQSEYRDWVGFCRIVGQKAGVVVSPLNVSG